MTSDMTEKTFLNRFRKHVIKMHKMISYQEMIKNLEQPERQWSQNQCPFFKLRYKPTPEYRLADHVKGFFFCLVRGRVTCVDDSRGQDAAYTESIHYWDANRDDGLKKKMINIIKEVRKSVGNQERS